MKKTKKTTAGTEKKPLRRAGAAGPKKKVLARAKTKTLSQKASAARDIGANLLAKATETIKSMVRTETPNPSTGANIAKPVDPAHSPGHRRLNMKAARGHVPAPKTRALPKHVPLKIPQP